MHTTESDLSQTSAAHASARHPGASPKRHPPDAAVDARAWLLCCLAEPGRIPPGWRPIALRLRATLTTVACDRRSRLRVQENPLFDPFDVLAPLVARDEVVKGMLRKANRQAWLTCRVCAAPSVRLQRGDGGSYCAAHSAAPYLRQLIARAAEQAEAIRLGAGRSRESRGAPEVFTAPGPLVEAWLAAVRASAREVEAVRGPCESARVELGDYDLARFAAWLEGLRAGVEAEMAELESGG